MTQALEFFDSEKSFSLTRLAHIMVDFISGQISIEGQKIFSSNSILEPLRLRYMVLRPIIREQIGHHGICPDGSPSSVLSSFINLQSDEEFAGLFAIHQSLFDFLSLENLR